MDCTTKPYKIKTEQDSTYLEYKPKELPPLYMFLPVNIHTIEHFSTETLWGSVPSVFNDPFDSLGIVKEQELKALLEKEYEKNPDLFDPTIPIETNIKEIIANTIKRFEAVRDNFVVSCFSPNIIPPIVPKKLFDQVQAVLDGRKTVRPKQNANPAYVLTDLLYCKKCGCSFSGATQTCGRNKIRYRAYTHTQKQREACKANKINAEYLEKAVKMLITNSINEYLKASPLSQTVFSRLEKETQEKVGKLSRYVSDLETKINLYLEKAANIHAASKLVERYEQQATECIEAQENARADIEKLNSKLKRIRFIKECSQKTSVLSVEEIFPTDEITRETIRIFIKRIEIDEENDDIEIIFHE